MIPAILAQIGVPVLTTILTEVFTRLDTPVTRAASDALSKIQMDDAQIAEANRHAEKMAQLKIDENIASITQVNESLRAETTSNDKYVRRMRPTFGYLMALTWAAQMFGIAYIMIFDTQRSVEVLSAMGSLSAIWAVGLSVLGVYVYKRSEEKLR